MCISVVDVMSESLASHFSSPRKCVPHCLFSGRREHFRLVPYLHLSTLSAPKFPPGARSWSRRGFAFHHHVSYAIPSSVQTWCGSAPKSVSPHLVTPTFTAQRAVHGLWLFLTNSANDWALVFVVPHVCNNFLFALCIALGMTFLVIPCLW